jgi:hypothetical protein
VQKKSRYLDDALPARPGVLLLLGGELAVGVVKGEEVEATPHNIQVDQFTSTRSARGNGREESGGKRSEGKEDEERETNVKSSASWVSMSSMPMMSV